MNPITITLYIFIALLGLCVGSFMNVCILRIPAGESIVTGPSHCMSCGRPLKWYELIPLFSWLALRGRCHGCRAKISAQYPLVEAANGALWLVVLYRLGFNVEALLGCLLGSVLLVASVIDARTREIPTGTTVFIAVLGAARAAVFYPEWRSSLLGLSVSALMLIILIVSGGGAIGGGDVKLMAGAGLFLGFGRTLLAFFLACVLGSVIHIARMKLAGAGRDLALGPYLSAGIMIALLWGNAMISWYLGVLGL